MFPYMVFSRIFGAILYAFVQCHRGRSLDTFFEGIQSDPVKLAVIGCGCSVATEPVAEISHRWNISQVSDISVTDTSKI